MKSHSILGPKTRLLILWAASVLAVLLLSISLQDVKLEPGRNFGITAAAGNAAAGGNPSTGNGLIRVLRIVSICCAVLSVISLIVHLASRDGRRRLLADLILIVLLVLLCTFLLSLRTPDAPPARKEAMAETGDAGGQPASAPSEAIPPRDDDPPPWMGWAAAAGLSLAAAAAGAGILAVVLRRRGTDGGMAREIAATADEAIGSLRAGEETRNVVIRCYADMSGIVAKERGIRRDADATAGEFAAVLTGLGIPEPPVRSLTRVFEEVRYGRAAATGESGRQALEALERIAAACREARG